MKKRSSSHQATHNATTGVVIGRERFEKISAVEGITLTSEMKKRAAEFERKGLSPEQRVRAIVDAHRKG